MIMRLNRLSSGSGTTSRRRRPQIALFGGCRQWWTSGPDMGTLSAT